MALRPARALAAAALAGAGGALLAAPGALGAAGTGAAAGKLYPGGAQALAPTPSEVGFAKLVGFERAKEPVAILRRGYRSGVVAWYQKGSAKVLTQAVATIYVYTTTATATRAWSRACSTCTREPAPGGLHAKAEAGTTGGVTTLHLVAACGNVYLDVVELDPPSPAAADTDVARITNAVYARATHFGLSSCAAK